MTSSNSPVVPSTESVHPLGRDLDQKTTEQALATFSETDMEAARAVANARPRLTAAVDLIANQMQLGGRLIYVGAGTSGRLAALDAAELPPTFQSAPERVVAVLAGGPGAMTLAVEGAEDDAQAGAQALKELAPGPTDCVFGISASGGAAFVHGALNEARNHGAHTLFLACVAPAERPDDYDVSIRLLTGPELLSGSTRLKAGTATKLALNAISTLVMARLGKLYGHRMIDVQTKGNRKLWARGLRLVSEVTGLPHPAAETLLKEAQGSVKIACAMHLRQLDRPQAEALLKEHAGHLRAIL